MVAGCWYPFVDHGGSGHLWVAVGAGSHSLMVLVGAGHHLFIVLVGAHRHLLLVLVHVHVLWSLFVGVGGGWSWFNGGRCH